MRYLFADYILKRRELRRGSEPMEAEPLLRLVEQREPDASLGISNLSEVLSFRPLDDLAKCAENPRKSGLSDSAFGRNYYVTCVTINNGLFLY